jgi:hypothetical protein
MFEDIEIRRHSYANKTGIIHIDRRKDFELRLLANKQMARPVIKKKFFRRNKSKGDSQKSY